jgi:hypothetical protein
VKRPNLRDLCNVAISAQTLLLHTRTFATKTHFVIRVVGPLSRCRINENQKTFPVELAPRRTVPVRRAVTLVPY